MTSVKIYFIHKDTKSKNKKQTKKCLLLSDKIEYSIRNITRDKGGHFIMTKGPIHHKDKKILDGADQLTEHQSKWSKKW